MCFYLSSLTLSFHGREKRTNLLAFFPFCRITLPLPDLSRPENNCWKILLFFHFTFTLWSARIWLAFLIFHNNHHIFDKSSILTFPTLPTSPALCTPGYPGYRQFVVKTIKIVTIVKIVNPGNQD